MPLLFLFLLFISYFWLLSLRGCPANECCSAVCHSKLSAEATFNATDSQSGKKRASLASSRHFFLRQICFLALTSAPVWYFPDLEICFSHLRGVPLPSRARSTWRTGTGFIHGRWEVQSELLVLWLRRPTSVGSCPCSLVHDGTSPQPRTVALHALVHRSNLS